MKKTINWDYVGQVRTLVIRYVPESKEDVQELEKMFSDLEDEF